jgi:CDP-diacylglycerol--glycerol-3-phosphate 3-phosphatidyltransferase
MNIPIFLTILRMIMTPIIVVIIYLNALMTIDIFINNSIIASILFALAAITDGIDGKIARSRSQITKLGTFLDPIADKFMVITVLITLVFVSDNSWHGLILAILATLTIAREILITGLREWMATINKNEITAVSAGGKMKAGFQMTGITMIIAAPSVFYFNLEPIALIVFGIGTILSLSSGWSYFYAARHYYFSE